MSTIEARATAERDQLLSEIDEVREQHERMFKVFSENAKLRELVRLMQICIEHACMCDFCPLFVSEGMNEQSCCIAEIDSRMRELGVEVP